MPALLNMALRLGVRMSLMPITAALLQLPADMASSALCAPTSEEEQAVSMARLGPRQLNRKLRRPAATEMAEPAAVWQGGRWVMGRRG
jgi:hypothetical protein